MADQKDQNQTYKSYKNRKYRKNKRAKRSGGQVGEASVIEQTENNDRPMVARPAVSQVEDDNDNLPRGLDHRHDTDQEDWLDRQTAEVS